jgi:hypothetical protein
MQEIIKNRQIRGMPATTRSTILCLHLSCGKDWNTENHKSACCFSRLSNLVSRIKERRQAENMQESGSEKDNWASGAGRSSRLEKNCIVKTFMIWTHQILFGRSNQVRCDGTKMWHVRRKSRSVGGVLLGTRKNLLQDQRVLGKVIFKWPVNK